MHRELSTSQGGGLADLESSGPSSARLLVEPQLSAELARTASVARRMAATAHLSSGGRDAFLNIVQSWASRKFAVGAAILFPMVVTVYLTWWFLDWFDRFFSPLYYYLFSFHVFGLGFLTSMVVIFLTGVFFSSWLGHMLLNFGEFIVRRLPLVKHIYAASKSVSAALNPDNEQSKAFQECVLIRHPRQGELAMAFITGKTVLQMGSSDTRLNVVYVPTNHVYIGDVFLLEDADVIRTNLSVREGLEIVVSVGMSFPSSLKGSIVHQART